MKALLTIVLLLTFGAYAYSEYTPEQIAEWRERAEKGEAWRAFNWYRKAAEQGLAQVQFNLGDMYANGNGVKEDKVQSYAWFNIAAANGHENAKEYKAEVAEKMTKEQIAKAQDLSREMNEAKIEFCTLPSPAPHPTRGPQAA